jgi:hypothetical protein
MARERRPGASRRQQGGLDAERLIYLGAGAVLVLVALIVIAGLYVTRWLPPRAEVLMVEDRTYTASEVADRGAYLAVFEQGIASVESAARDTLDRLLEEETLRRRGPALVGEVTERDLQRELRARLGFDAGDLAEEATATPGPEGTATPAAGVTATPEATATSAATATATPTATPAPTATLTPFDQEEFAKDYQAFLQQTGLSRRQFERIVEAQIIRERLELHFDGQVGESGPQVNLARIRVRDFALAEAIRSEVAEGTDFAEQAQRHSVDELAEDGGEIGWRAIEQLDPAVTEAVSGLEAGEVSEPVQVGALWELYLVQERDEEREFDPLVRLALVERRIEDWLDGEQQALSMQEDLSDGEANWIRDQVVGRAREIATRLAGGRR